MVPPGLLQRGSERGTGVSEIEESNSAQTVFLLQRCFHETTDFLGAAGPCGLPCAGNETRSGSNEEPSIILDTIDRHRKPSNRPAWPEPTDRSQNSALNRKTQEDELRNWALLHGSVEHKVRLKTTAVAARPESRSRTFWKSRLQQLSGQERGECRASFRSQPLLRGGVIPFSGISE